MGIFEGLGLILDTISNAADNAQMDREDARKNKGLFKYDNDNGESGVVAVREPTVREGYSLGRIKWYDDQKRYGFIRGKDGTERFFHVSAVKSFEPPTNDALVEYKPLQNEKGLQAIDVHVLANEKRPEFIAFGSTRIKLKNIKSYGLTSSDFGHSETIYIFGPSSVWKEDIRRYLYVATYQNDNYRFFEDEVSFNIQNKCAELDKWLS